jgi:putative lipoic acid-binding regulatory protein
MRVTAQATARPAGRVRPSPGGQFNGVKVFSATMFADRERLGESITAWLAARPNIQVTQMVVTQSSDAAFHCIAITVFYWESIAGR